MLNANSILTLHFVQFLFASVEWLRFADKQGGTQVSACRQR